MIICTVWLTSQILCIISFNRSSEVCTKMPWLAYKNKNRVFNKMTSGKNMGNILAYQLKGVQKTE